jgi:hypothetical protein
LRLSTKTEPPLKQSRSELFVGFGPKNLDLEKSISAGFERSHTETGGAIPCHVGCMVQFISQSVLPVFVLNLKRLGEELHPVGPDFQVHFGQSASSVQFTKKKLPMTQCHRSGRSARRAN